MASAQREPFTASERKVRAELQRSSSRPIGQN